MWWMLVAILVVVAALAVVLQRRGAAPDPSHDTFRDAGATKAPESFHTPGYGGGNSGGFSG